VYVSWSSSSTYGGDSGNRIFVLYCRCSLIRVSVIRGSTVHKYIYISFPLAGFLGIWTIIFKVPPRKKSEKHRPMRLTQVTVLVTSSFKAFLSNLLSFKSRHSSQQHSSNKPSLRVTVIKIAVLFLCTYLHVLS
jgi:hypothetical protein